KLFGSLQPKNLCVGVDESANFFQRLFPSWVAWLIAEGDQSHDEDRTNAMELPVPREAGTGFLASKNGCASSFSSARCKPQSYMRGIAALRGPGAYRFRRALVSLDP